MKEFFVLVFIFQFTCKFVDSPDVTLAGTDDNYDLLLSETNYL